MKNRNNANFSRRNALKLLGIGVLTGSGAVGVNATKAEAKTTAEVDIVILGAGLAGISLAAKLRKLAPNSNITIVDRDDPLFYQPGFTLIAAGIYEPSDVAYQKEDILPSEVNFVKEFAIKIDPNNNIVTTESGKELKYNYLAIATGAVNDFSTVKGLSEEDIGNGTIASIYTMNGASAMSELRKKVAKDGGTFLFCEPKTPFKCAGANKKVNFLTEDQARIEKTRDKLKTILFSGSAAMFSVPIYAKLIEGKFLERDMEYKLSHQLIEVRQNEKVAVFERYMPYRENGENKVATEIIEQKYDYLHFVPRMRVPQFVADAGLSITKGDVDGNWVDVTRETLQHTRYKNIFAIGDCAGVPMGKTGASIRKMYPVVAQNMVDMIEGKPLSAQYGGYTSCPLLTKYGKAILVEFDWSVKPTPSLECLGATRETYMNWAMKIYMLKPMVMQGMLRGLV